MKSVHTPKVAYVLGVYRSGTTLLSNLMGQLEGYFCVGELRAIWRELGLPSARCGCGMPLIECDTWQRILDAAYGGVTRALEVAPRMLHWQGHALGQSHRWKRLPALFRHRDLATVDAATRHYAEGLSRLYQAIATVTGARVIVDSSKEPTDAAMIRLLPGLSLSLVHIVRDPRGNVFSSIRARSRGKAPRRPRWGESAYAAMSWMAGNLAASAVRRAEGQRSVLLRYEDLVDVPDRTLQRIARLVGEAAPAPRLEDGAMLMAPTHTVCGNENRFRIGRVNLAQDKAWQSNLMPLDRYVVTAICSPLMMQYGYRLTR